MGEAPRHHAGLAVLSLGALGIVFGDIGTSPLYALQTVFAADEHAVRPTESGVYGVISLVFWAITLIVSIKYVALIMRADNEGEGGIMALIALIREKGLQRRFAQVDARRAGDLRRLAVLRRRHDHAGDLGALRGRGDRGGRAEPARAGGADHAGDPGRAVRDPALRHRRGRPAGSGRSWRCGSRCWRSRACTRWSRSRGSCARSRPPTRSRSCSSTATSPSSRSAPSC